MSARDSNGGGGGLSATTLAIASLSSLAAALIVHKFWQAGAFVGAAVTPVIVALVSEGLRRPVDVVKSRATTVNPPPVVTERRDDPFGIWEDQQKAPRGRRRLHVGLAVATGLVAFVIAGFLLTGAELVLGGASGGDKYRFVPGKQQKKDGDRDRDDAPADTQPEDLQQEEPSTLTEETPPEETVPEETPEETVPTPPEETAPAPPDATTPAEPQPIP
jgi:hypothetical protein